MAYNMLPPGESLRGLHIDLSSVQASSSSRPIQSLRQVLTAGLAFTAASFQSKRFTDEIDISYGDPKVDYLRLSASSELAMGGTSTESDSDLLPISEETRYPTSCFLLCVSRRIARTRDAAVKKK
jgi:hypothetical protein